MARRFPAGVATAAFLWLAVAAGFCPRATGAEGGLHEDETPPDLEFIRGKAEAGVAKAQTLLADFYVTAGDFTNAVVWYRKAAEQNDVGAQLTLASFLVTGQGTAKNPTEAASWLRAAARLIESPASKAQAEGAAPPIAPAAGEVAAPRPALPSAEGVSTVPAPPVRRSIIITKATAAPAAAPSVTHSPAPPNPAPVANTPRVKRVHLLPANALVLQESPPVFKSYSNSR